MSDTLPTAEQLAKLPLRAVVAYAANTARRLSSELQGSIADDILDDALNLVESVATTDPIGDINIVSIMSAAERVTAAYAELAANQQSIVKFRIVFSLTNAALSAMYVHLAAGDPQHTQYQMHAAQQAERAIRVVKFLSNSARNNLMQAALNDYHLLVREYGEHENVVIGKPIDCFLT